MDVNHAGGPESSRGLMLIVQGMIGSNTSIVADVGCDVCDVGDGRAVGGTWSAVTVVQVVRIANRMYDLKVDVIVQNLIISTLLEKLGQHFGARARCRNFEMESGELLLNSGYL